jgi:hypothetical protein
VKVIVDANIVFSGILNSNSKIADILINSGEQLIFIAPNFLRIEINKYHSKISKLTGMTAEEVQESEFQICKKIKFISEEQIAPAAWEFAEKGYTQFISTDDLLNWIESLGHPTNT